MILSLVLSTSKPNCSRPAATQSGEKAHHKANPIMGLAAQRAGVRVAKLTLGQLLGQGHQLLVVAERWVHTNPCCVVSDHLVHCKFRVWGRTHIILYNSV